MTWWMTDDPFIPQRPSSLLLRGVSGCPVLSQVWSVILAAQVSGNPGTCKTLPAAPQWSPQNQWVHGPTPSSKQQWQREGCDGELRQMGRAGRKGELGVLQCASPCNGCGLHPAGPTRASVSVLLCLSALNRNRSNVCPDHTSQSTPYPSLHLIPRPVP